MLAATPLVGLDAVVIDTETTGLDTNNARIVQIGAVRIVKGALREDERFETLVDPGEPIPAAATAIHSIDTSKVSGAPRFREAFDALRAFARNAILIGHSVAFDLAVIAQECARAGVSFEPIPALDTELLAEIANPRLPGTGLESLAAWLGIEVVDRHSAIGDALMTARIFLGMIPHLRSRGIRTQGEAEAACRSLLDARVSAGQAGLEVPAGGRGESMRPFARIDSYPFRHRNRDLMSSPPQLIGSDRSLEDAIHVMTGAKVSSLFVRKAGEASPFGIVTERDVMRAVATDGAAALGRPVGDVASSSLISVDADDYVYRAIARMAGEKIRHLAVVGGAGDVVGALSARDLLRLRAGEAVTLDDDIDRAEEVGALAAAWSRLPAVAAALLGEGIAAIDIAAIISRELAAMTARAAVIGEARLAAAGQGTPPVPYAVLVLGSAGRGESLLAADQDNAIVHAGQGQESDVQGQESDVDPWFAALGKHIADILHESGIPYCKGGVMAANAGWRRSVESWHATVGEWVGRSNPNDLLNVDIFFDLAPVHGEMSLGEELWRHAYDIGSRRADFAKLLAEAGGDHRPPLSLFGGFQTTEGRIDLKIGGLLPLVSGARVLSIRHHVLARSTPERLVGVRQLDKGGDTDLDRLVEVHRLLLDHMLRQQVADIENGVPPSSRIEIKRLSRSQRTELRDALKSLDAISSLIRDLLF